MRVNCFNYLTLFVCSCINIVLQTYLTMGEKEERWQTKITSLKEGIAHIYETKEFSDVTFLVHGDSFQAHKLLLAARSSTFAGILLKPSNHNEIIVDEKTVTKTGFKILLRFIYLDMIGTSDKQAIIEAYLAAQYYGQKALKTKCEEEMNSWIINTDEVLKLLDDGSSVPVLKDRCIQFIRNHAQEVLSSLSFESATFKSLCIILENGSLKNVPPLERIRQIMKWGANHKFALDGYCGFREKLLACSLLGRLEFEKLSLDDLQDVICDYPDLLTSQETTCFMRYNKRKDASCLPDWCSPKAEPENSV